MTVRKINVAEDAQIWGVPPETLSSLKRYIEQGVEIGGFLRAVLENDLFGAVNRADFANGIALLNIVRFIFNTLPYQCHGSHEKVEDWLDREWRTYVRD